MRKVLRIVLVVLILLFVALQFFQPEKNSSEPDAAHFYAVETVPGNIKTIFDNACMDCHSDKTKYLWYHHISPVSWMVNKHIVDGKDELNLSQWGDLDLYDRIATLEEICQEVERNKMPLKSYTLIHPKAKISEQQEAELCEWTEKLALELLTKLEE